MIMMVLSLPLQNYFELNSKLPLPLAARLQTDISTSHHDSLS